MSVTAGPAALEARHLNVLLGGLPILRDVSLRIEAGEIVALMGGNGSGKTTLVRTLLGLLPHQHGSIELFGTPIEDFREWWRLGYVPQRGATGIRQATVGEVVATGRLAHRRPFAPSTRRDREVVAATLERVGIPDLAQRPFVELSGGQQQRVLIARALAGEASLLVLDEPLAGVDLATQQRLADLIAELNRDGMTALIVLHELGPFEGMLTRAVVLREGRVLAEGAPPRGGHHGHEVEPPTATALVHGPLGEGN